MEQPKSPEMLEQRLIALLKERGPGDPETQELLIAWTLEQERIADATEDSSGRIELDRKRGRLYFAAGHKNEAFKSFEAALEQAWNEGREELCQQIQDEIKDILK